MTIKSGTEEVYDFVQPYIAGLAGIDIGFGGASISPTAINIDQIKPYTKVGSDPQHLKGDARNMTWFADESLDYVYSSHLLEDFPNTAEVLREWVRVLKKGGLMILQLPNEQKYRSYCKSRGEGRNTHHTIDNMSIKYMLPILKSVGLRVEYAADKGLYSFLTISRKI